MNKLQFIQTPHNTIRVWLYFDEEHHNVILKSNEYMLFQLVCAWGGYDKREKGVYSWELPMSLKQFIKEKFANFPNCEINVL